MAERVESPQVLLEMLDMLCSLQGCVSYADVCVCLSRRFALPALCELRSLLYSTACRDPCFPATLFRGRLHPAATSSLSAAADVVSLFNLITVTRPPFYTLPLPSDAQLPFGPAAPFAAYAAPDWPAGGEGVATGAEGEREAEGGAGLTHSPAVQDAQSDSVAVPEPANESAGLERVTAKRRVFRADFHNVPTLDATDAGSQPGSTESVDGASRGRNEDVLFLSLKNPYPDPSAPPRTRPHAEGRRLKHESVDGADGSSYFGPSARDWPPAGQTLPPKSHSLEDGTRERSPGEPGLRDYELKGSLSVESGAVGAGIGQTGMPEFRPVGSTHAYSAPIGSTLSDSGAVGSSLGGSGPVGSAQGDSGLTGSGLSVSSPAETSSGGSAPIGLRLGGSGPIGMQTPGFEEVRAALKRLSGRSLDLLSQDWPAGAEGVSSVSTQTDAASRLRSLNKLSVDNSDIAEDDISAIFRFLDDISMCGSVAALVPEGGGAEAGGGAPSSPDRRSRLGKLKRLFHSLEAPPEGAEFGAGLGAGLGRLLLRVSEVEKRLEPLGDLTHTLTHILATLQRLEAQTSTLTRKPALMEPPALRDGRSVGTATSMATTTAAKRRGVVTRRDLTESSSTWSVSYSKEQHTHTRQARLLSKDREGCQSVCADQRRRLFEETLSLEAQLGFNFSSISGPAETESTEGLISEQSLTPSLMLEGPGADPRGARSPNPSQRDPSWSQSELTPMELQAPDPLDFWMDEIYTPASDRLLQRQQQRRPPRCPSRGCPPPRASRIAALCLTAAAILVLIIVIPIATA